MKRRCGGNEVGFGSDSFLDIVANIVGILIILIVIAGLRVSNAPVVQPLKETAAEEETPLPAITPDSAASDPAPLNESAVRDESSVPVEPESESPPDEVATPEPALPENTISAEELRRQQSALEAELARIESERAAQRRQLEQFKQAEEALQGRLQTATTQLEKKTRQFEQLRRQYAQRQRDRDRTAKEKSELDRHIEQAESDSQPVIEIKHRLTPVSQMVTGKEVHFRIAQNRVSYVPIEELIERLRPQFERQKHWLLKYNSHEGQVGPVDGYRLNYRMERQRLSAIEELRQGRGMLRVSVTEWHVVPDSDLVTEGLDEVLRPGSAFLRVIGRTNRDAVLTFWVYPDSFRMYRLLQQFAHDQGFTVAGRPLPFGLPIAGSPQGSRSAGQ